MITYLENDQRHLRKRSMPSHDADVATAVNRWTKTELVNSLLEIPGMAESSSGRKETHHLRMRKDNENLKSL